MGEWQGDTLVIDSQGFNEKFWLAGGLPHTEQMQVIERITRPDYDTLTYERPADSPAGLFLFTARGPGTPPGPTELPRAVKMTHGVLAESKIPR